MWKALIKLVEKWAYRCEHNWQMEQENKVYSSDNTTRLPHSIIRTFICTKCMEHKILTT